MVSMSFLDIAEYFDSQEVFSNLLQLPAMNRGFHSAGAAPDSSPVTSSENLETFTLTPRATYFPEYLIIIHLECLVFIYQCVRIRCERAYGNAFPYSWLIALRSL
jgi:hypothetical protein